MTYTSDAQESLLTDSLKWTVHMSRFALMSQTSHYSDEENNVDVFTVLRRCARSAHKHVHADLPQGLKQF